MEIIVRKPVINQETKFVEFTEIPLEQVKVDEPSLMSIDGSTTCSGISILNDKGYIIYSMAFKRDKEENETPVQYKVKFKRKIYQILSNNPKITQVYYEEPFLGYAEAAKVLMMLRTSVEELIAEHDPDLNYLSLTEVSNKKWKKIYLAPEKCPTGTEAEKKAVRDKMVKELPLMETVTQDEIDAAAMGFVALWKTESHRQSELSSSKKVRPFQYKVEFIGANDDSGLFEELGYIFSENKLSEEFIDTLDIYELDGKGNFDNYVYNAIGNEDKIVILKFRSKHYGNIILKYRIGNLATEYDYIYAVCWRKNRHK